MYTITYSYTFSVLILLDADSDNDDNQNTRPSVVIDSESIAAKSKSSHSDSGYNTVSSKCPPSQTSSAVRTDFEIDLDIDPEVFYSTATMFVNHNYASVRMRKRGI